MPSFFLLMPFLAAGAAALPDLECAGHQRASGLAVQQGGDLHYRMASEHLMEHKEAIWAKAVAERAATGARRAWPESRVWKGRQGGTLAPTSTCSAW
jgi:hypothetical protein